MNSDYSLPPDIPEPPPGTVLLGQAPLDNLLEIMRQLREHRLTFAPGLFRLKFDVFRPAWHDGSSPLHTRNYYYAVHESCVLYELLTRNMAQPRPATCHEF